LRRTIKAEATIAARPETIFACLTDYEQADVFIEGLQKLDPLGVQTAGEGARFSAVLSLGGRFVHTTIVIASLRPGRLVTWASVGDEGQSLTFELAPDETGTTVKLAVAYEEPGGIAGALIAPFVERTVQHRADTALERLGKEVSPDS
jgi:uncharacterized membrane protein